MFTTVEELMIQALQPSVPTPPPRILNTSRPSQFIDVHQFDYSYKNVQHKPVTLSNTERVYIIERLISKMKDPIAINGARIIMANIGNDANRDSTNQKNADDILCLLALHIEKDADLLPLLEEQLADMVQLGQCAQGRTTRLWQLLTTL